MHEAVRQWVTSRIEWVDPCATIVELGSLDINGGVRDLLPPSASYIGVDMQKGPGVDVVDNAATWRPEGPVDLVLCLEVFEHTPEWRDIITNVSTWNTERTLHFIGTCATIGRAPHSARSEGRIEPDEHYRNIAPFELSRSLDFAGFQGRVVQRQHFDVRWHATQRWETPPC